MRLRPSALMVLVPLFGLLLLAGANILRVYQLEHTPAFDVSSVGGTYSFHAGAPVRSLELTQKPWAAPSAARLAVSRGNKMLFGVETKTGPFDLHRVAQFQQAVKRDVDIVQYSRSWSQPFQSFLAEDVWRRGAIPLLTWEPWTYAYGTGPGGAVINQPGYNLHTIIDGSHDHYIRTYARALKRFGHPILLRFGPEMNGNWNSWSEGVNGNKTGEYVRAWRRIHRIFDAQGATNVIWVWAPNVLYTGSKPLAGLYPGDRYVDVVALDGYNWGHLHSWTSWRGFDTIFGPSLAAFKQIAPWKPVLITETASTEIGGSKVAWIRDLFAGLRRNPQIVGVNWFNQVKETDWRVQSSPAAAREFAAEAASFPVSPAAKRFRAKLWRIDKSFRASQKASALLEARTIAAAKP
jgi:hypothetical protein